MFFVDREDARRVISLGKANSREVKRYAQSLNRETIIPQRPRKTGNGARHGHEINREGKPLERGWQTQVNELLREDDSGTNGSEQRRICPGSVELAQPFTHTTCLSVCTTSTRFFCASITASMSL